MAEKHAGRVAIVGVNNESMFRAKEHDVAHVRSFLTENKDGFRYTVYVDTAEGHARECKSIDRRWGVWKAYIVKPNVSRITAN